MYVCMHVCMYVCMYVLDAKKHGQEARLLEAAPEPPEAGSFVHLLSPVGVEARDLVQYPYHISVCYLQDIWREYAWKRHQMYRLQNLYVQHRRRDGDPHIVLRERGLGGDH